MQYRDAQPSTDSPCDSPISRRQLLLKTLLAAGGLSCFAVTSEATNLKLSPADPVAKNAGYVEDATRVDIKKYPTYAHGQSCVNCSSVQLRYARCDPAHCFPARW